MKRILALALTLALAAACWAEVKIDGDTKVPAFAIVDLKATLSKAGQNTQYRWKVLTGEPTSIIRLNDRLLLSGPPGKYRLSVTVVDFDAKVFDEAEVAVTIGDPPPPVPPVPPGPTPPGPTPSVAPIDGPGFRVLILYESADKSKYPAEQAIIFNSKRVQDYLRSKCVKDTNNPEGAFRIWDKDEGGGDDDPAWAKAAKRERKSLPWLMISDGKAGYEGPLPENVDKTLELLKKYGG